MAMADNLYAFTVRNAEDEEISLKEFKDKVILIVNVASKCGFTPQYTGLEALYTRFREQGFVLLGFPCNQFGSQEPGTNEEIQSFCKSNYAVTFPVFSKLEVNGAREHPLYAHLKSAAPGILGTEAIKWNFTKFLVSREGQVLRRYPPQAEPKSLEEDVAKALS
jgi:glutathione peroxidase